MSRRSTAAGWVLGWCGAPVLAVANGVLRDTTYARRLGEQAGHQLSTATLLAALAGWTSAVERRYPLPDRPTALRVGAGWALGTVAFEVVLGRARHAPWRQLAADWDVRHGRLWPLVPLTMLVGPEVARRRGAVRGSRPGVRAAAQR